jgi:hypothetical protein
MPLSFLSRLRLGKLLFLLRLKNYSEVVSDNFTGGLTKFYTYLWLSLCFHHQLPPRFHLQKSLKKFRKFKQIKKIIIKLLKTKLLAWFGLVWVGLV